MKYKSKRQQEHEHARRSDRPREKARDREPKSDSGQSTGNWVSGRKPAQEILLHAGKRVAQVFLDERLEASSLPEALKSELKKLERITKRLPREAMDERFPGHHQGVALLLHPKPEADLEEIIRRAKEHPTEVIVVLDEITDPQNLGSILRAAEAFGVAGVVLTERRSADISASTVRVSAGASELVRTTTVKNLQRAIETMKEEGVWVVGTAIGKESRSSFRIELVAPLALVFGSEGAGMRALTKKLCDELVEIPLPGRIQSLNVNQAVSILLHEAARQLSVRLAEKSSERSSST